MKLECFRVPPYEVEIRPGTPDRDWIDNHTHPRHPYRCLPMVIANCSGWELLCPSGFSVTWNGKRNISDLIINFDEPNSNVGGMITSHFADGILTFRTGYVFRTDPGWDMWIGGSPNLLKKSIQPLAGVIETSWMPFLSTMNWKFTAPGTIRFEKGEPFAFIMPIRHAEIDDCQPVIRELASDPQLEKEVHEWSTSRSEFMKAKRNGDPEALAEGWQKHYYRGIKFDGTKIDDHVHRRRLKKPIKEEPSEP